MEKTLAEQRRVELTKPEPGYYLIKLCPGGWRVAARIVIDYDCVRVIQDGIELPQYWRLADLDIHAGEAMTEGRLFEHPLFRILLFGERSDETTYRHRLAIKAWAQEHKPNHPCLTPYKRADPALTPAIDF